MNEKCKFSCGKEEFANAGPMPDMDVLDITESSFYYAGSSSYKLFSDTMNRLYCGHATGYPEEEE